MSYPFGQFCYSHPLVPTKTAGFLPPAATTGKLTRLGTSGSVAFQKINTATDQPLGQRYAEMASAAIGPPLVEFQNDRAVGHVSHIPHRPVVERVDFHRDTFRKKRRQGRHPKALPLP